MSNAQAFLKPPGIKKAAARTGDDDQIISKRSKAGGPITVDDVLTDKYIFNVTPSFNFITGLPQLSICIGHLVLLS